MGTYPRHVLYFSRKFYLRQFDLFPKNQNFDPSCFDPIQTFWYVDARTNSDFRSRSFDLFPPTRYIEGVSRSHILLNWISRWLYPDFATHSMNLVHRVDNDPMLMKVNATKRKMRTAIEQLLDINPSMNNVAYKGILNSSPLCPCKEEKL